MADLVGRQIEQYQILSLVGRGGMGAVYKAQDQHLARHVALKVMHPHLADQSQFKQRFMQEAQAAAGLDHPSIVQIYDFGYQQEALYMVMPFIGGGSLADHNRELAQSKKTAKLDEALYLLAQVATALAYAHQQGIVHRDVKPDNVLLKRLFSPDRAGEPPLRAVVTDFGLAKLVEGGVKTETGTFMGTLPYMSPEQALGKELDGRSDIYSLGVILYQLATGQLPLQINSPTEAVRKHMHETPPPPRTVEPALPDELEAIIERAIAKAPDERFQSGTDMARALRSAAANLTEAAVTQLATSRGPAVSLVTQLASDEPAQPSRIGDELAPLPEADQLVIARAGEAPRTQKLDKPTMTVGRDEDNDIILDAPEVSAQQARLQQTESGWQVSDLDSTNGTYLDDNRLLPNVPEQWEMGQMLRLGPYFLRWQQATEPEAGTGASRYQATQVSAGASQIESAAGQLSLVVNPTEATVAAGDQTGIQVTLFNQGDTVGRFQLNVEDLPSSWVTMSQDTVNLMPGEQTELSVALHPPQDSQATAGPHPYRLVVSSTLEEQAAVFSGQLNIEPFQRFEVEVSPAHLDHGQRCQVTVRNQGNADTSYQVTGQDPAQAIGFEGEQTVTVPAGQEETTSLTLSAKEQPFTGRKQTLPFAVQVSTDTGKEKTEVGQLTVPPRYSIGCLALIAVLLLVLASATCCLSGLPGGGDGGGTRRTPAPPAIEEEVEPAEPVEEELAPQSRKEIEAVSVSHYTLPAWHRFTDKIVPENGRTWPRPGLTSITSPVSERTPTWQKNLHIS